MRAWLAPLRGICIRIVPEICNPESSYPLLYLRLASWPRWGNYVHMYSPYVQPQINVVIVKP